MVQGIHNSAPDKKIWGQLAMFLHKNIFRDPSLEPSLRDGTNKGSQHMFLLRHEKNYF